MTTLADKFSPNPNPKPTAAPAARPTNRNAKPCLMLRIGKKSGAQWAVPYAYLVEVHMPPDRKHIELRFTHRRFIVKGIRIAGLFDALLDHSLGLLEESTSPFDESIEDEAYISEIETLETGA